jgi:hypothetical protein
MASPISITPVLTNKDSVKFNKDLESNRSNKISKEEKERITNLVKLVLEKKNSKK